uniref:Tr-type G domain-containing protein n=1 Tax=Elaeophora elaphi TaxID=1147741 RepID=A0A0R3RSY2_9BILA
MANSINALSLIDIFKNFENSLPPEVEEGNIEYKVKLVDPSLSRMQHLITQMKWRLREGQGEAIYEIGVQDDGTIKGLTDKELDASMRTLKSMATALNASIVVLRERDVTPKSVTCCRRRVLELLVRKVPDNQQFIGLRIAILGSANAGKSTLCGVLTQGHLDNGHGKARLNLFRYLHEFQTGRTSSICLDMIGFDSQGKLINYSEHSLEEIAEQSTKLITLIDLAGDRKYLKTTIYGLTGYLPHFAALVISAVTGPTSITREHLGLSVALNIPVFVVITKVDAVTTATREKVLHSINMLLKRPGMECIPKRVESSDAAVCCASAMLSRNVVPVFLISNVSGLNLHLLKQFLNVLPSSSFSKLKQDEISLNAVLFSIEEVYRVPQVSVVVCGVLMGGILREKDAVQIGPFKDGNYHIGRIETIRRNKQPVHFVRPGEAASIALALDGTYIQNIRRGMVLLNAKDEGIACRRFTARLYLLYHPANEICVGFQGTVYIGSVCQTATIMELDAPSIVPCQWVTVQFEFYSCPEYVRVGTPLIFRESKTKGMGEVVHIFGFDLTN